MPKITINPEGQGLRQTRGKGLHHLSADNKGYAYHVKSGSVTLTGTDDSEINSGIYIPPNAVITRLSIQKTVISVDAAGSAMEFEVDEIHLGSYDWKLAATDKIVTDS